MHQFICKAVSRKIVPVQPSKLNLLEKLLNSYEDLDKKFLVTIQIIEKDINSQQEALYKAFIIKASNHFGNTYQEMENMLKRFYPLNSFHAKDYKSLNKWSSDDLTNFINKATAFLAEYGFTFE